jgi:hypothetical protein
LGKLVQSRNQLVFVVGLLADVLTHN